MRGRKVLEREGFAIGLQLVTVGEGMLGQGLRGRGVEMQVVQRAVWSSIQDRLIMRLGHALLSVTSVHGTSNKFLVTQSNLNGRISKVPAYNGDRARF